MLTIVKKDIIDIFFLIFQKIKENKDELTRLDSELGDGDLGITMYDGFSAICDSFGKFENVKDMGILFKKIGFVMGETVPSTMGTLLSIGLVKAGDVVKDKEVITLEDTPLMLSNVIAAMVQRGKAKNRGDKTILDALYPALTELENAVKAKSSLREAFENASSGAKAGVEATKLMKSTVGKAAIYGDQSIGKQDPGATVAMYIFEGIANYFRT
ncbi:MAG: dihydroxyacetone kinase subunit L [Ruminiclostridium sp.]